MNKFTFLFIMGIFLTGCATSSLQTGHIYKDMETGKEKYNAKEVLADTGFFTPSTADAIRLECFTPEPFVVTDVATGERHVTPNDLEGEELFAESRCQIVAEAHDYQTGAASSFVAPVIGSVAHYYGMKKMGEGIGKSGDQTTNTNISRNKNENENENENENYNKNYNKKNGPEVFDFRLYAD